MILKYFQFDYILCTILLTHLPQNDDERFHFCSLGPRISSQSKAESHIPKNDFVESYEIFKIIPQHSRVERLSITFRRHCLHNEFQFTRFPLQEMWESASTKTWWYNKSGICHSSWCRPKCKKLFQIFYSIFLAEVIADTEKLADVNDVLLKIFCIGWLSYILIRVQKNVKFLQLRIITNQRSN